MFCQDERTQRNPPHEQDVCVGLRQQLGRLLSPIDQSSRREHRVPHRLLNGGHQTISCRRCSHNMHLRDAIACANQAAVKFASSRHQNGTDRNVICTDARHSFVVRYQCLQDGACERMARFDNSMQHKVLASQRTRKERVVFNYSCLNRPHYRFPPRRRQKAKRQESNS